MNNGVELQSSFDIPTGDEEYEYMGDLKTYGQHQARRVVVPW